MDFHKERKKTLFDLPSHRGLSDDEVKTARKKYGENVISRKKTRGFLSRLVGNFNDPMIKIMLIALLINVVFMFNKSDWYETAGITTAVLLSVVISTLSEQGSESAFKKLQEEASMISCRVIRKKNIVELPISEIVVGDLVSLQPGDRIPADGVIIDGELDVDQSALNGETKEAKKIPSKRSIRESGGLLEPELLFCGTVVCAGHGVMRVKSVGDNTFYGGLAVEVQDEKGDSPLKERLGRLAASISKFGYIGAFFVALAYLVNVYVLDNDFVVPRIISALENRTLLFEHLLHAVTLAVTVIVVAVPEGLPMMISVVLTSNMKRMLKDNVLVRKLVGIETAGSLNILLTDKTGTLTSGKLQVTGFIDGDGKVWDSTNGIQSLPLWRHLHRAVKYNTSSSMSGNTAVGGNATDRALLEYVSKNPASHSLKKLDSIPFDSKRKFMATRVSGEINGTLVKGAPELLLPHCVSYITPEGGVVPFTQKKRVEQEMENLQNDAARLIALTVSARPVTESSAFPELCLVGIAAVRDDVRREAAEGVRQIKRAGIQVVMITGDAKNTALAIAKRTGLIDGENSIVLTSSELNALDDMHLAQILPKLRVVARAMPQDKSRIVRVAQSMGLVTGMTGDGVNDAPALKRADIGFAMGSGTEVAKEAGDIVILDDNLLSIAKAIRYGRTIFKSIRKFIIFQLTMNFCAMCVSVIAPMIGVDAPITVIQMLWINIVMDTLGGLAFGGEPALMRYMREAPKKRDEPIINSYMRREIFFGGLYAIAVCIWFLKSNASAAMFASTESTRFLTAFFALFMFTGIASSVAARTHNINPLDHLAGNKAFVVIMTVVVVIQLCMVYFGGPVFRTNGLAPSELLFVLLLSSTALLAHMIRLMWYQWMKLPTGT